MLDQSNPHSYALEDRYNAEKGRVFMTGTQALVRLPLMQVTQQQLAHPNLAAISRPHQRAGVIESRRRVIRRQSMRPAKGADRRLAIV